MITRWLSFISGLQPTQHVDMLRADMKVDKDKDARAVQLQGQHPQYLYLLLASGSILSAIIFSTIQEKVFHIEGFTFGGWMTFLQYCTFAACGFAENVVMQRHERHGKLRDYAGISLLAMVGSYSTNWALNFVNYSTRIVFKSSRVLPVMLFRTIIVGQRYCAGDYAAGSLLVAGISCFTLGDADLLPKFKMAGVLLMMAALLCDAATANLEERQLFRTKTPCRHSEVMLYLSLFGAAESLVALVATGELRPALTHSQAHPEVLLLVALFSCAGYVTVSLILLIIRHFGSTHAEIVKSMRKVVQIALSLLLFRPSVGWKHAVGGVAVGVALWALQRSKRQALLPAAATGTAAAAALLPGGEPKAALGKLQALSASQEKLLLPV